MERKEIPERKVELFSKGTAVLNLIDCGLYLCEGLWTMSKDGGFEFGRHEKLDNGLSRQ